MRKRKKFKGKLIIAVIIIILILAGIGSCGEDETNNSSSAYSVSDAMVELQTDVEEDLSDQREETILEPSTSNSEAVIDSYDASESLKNFDYSSIPVYSGKAYVVVNNNNPFFTDADMTTTSYESYSSLDSKGRCGVCMASVGKDIMPTEERGTIGDVKPSGWNQVKYSGVVDGNYLYNRCHLIGYQLTGENANVRNLITGTRYLNMEGMLPFENMVADYVQETGNHVVYRVTPVFEGDNLLASGVLMEAKSVEDDGDGILYCVFCYNVQPGVQIDYSDGSSYLNATTSETNNSNSTTNKTGSSGATSNSGTVVVPITTPSTDSTSTTESEPEMEDNDVSTGSDTMVWLSETGSKYHSINDCGNMNPSKATQTTESNAILQGKGKCSKCW